MAGQLALDDRWTDRPRAAPAPNAGAAQRGEPPVLCAACQAREARYGFRADSDDPLVERPRTLCFECFRAEIARRQEAARAVQVRLPLEERSTRSAGAAAARRSRPGTPLAVSGF